MRARTLAEVAEAVRGRVRPAEAAGTVVRGVSTDSRRVRPGDLFVALPGAHTDGHRFVGQALAAGAAAALVREGHPGLGEPSGPVVEAADPLRGLLDLAADERRHLRGTVVGITGSTGKTSTKDFTAAVLSRRLQVAASPASYNNEVGLPLTLLGAPPDAEALVLEMGSRGRGHIRLLCEVARPLVGVVTNVGVAHMELFRSPEVLRDAKAELPEALPPEGTAVLNADDPVVRSYRARTPAAAVLYGLGPEAAVRAEAVRLDEVTAAARFRLVLPEGSAEVALPVPGEHMVPNALAAAAVGWVLGLTAEECAEGLARASLSAGRMRLLTTPGGLRVLDDSYNANPTSMAAALKTARRMAGRARCVAVLGFMAELGPISVAEHERLGELVVRLGVDHLVVVGEEARLVGVSAAREGLEADRLTFCRDPEEAAEAIRRVASPGDLVLVKASRAARLERVVRALGAEPAPPGVGATEPRPAPEGVGGR
ncbi:MAG TPA: UDP-N-acetylmuramoyl-tripeptide--D-alanyl-D-alanine ligase [Actinomycetota bacterium]|nr:UDP-N-acetylmuramoyl-tripeptide--D-alanyl-D-alanine ligase [Actinomycetota bacterium]